MTGTSSGSVISISIGQNESERRRISPMARIKALGFGSIRAIRVIRGQRIVGSFVVLLLRRTLRQLTALDVQRCVNGAPEWRGFGRQERSRFSLGKFLIAGRQTLSARR